MHILKQNRPPCGRFCICGRAHARGQYACAAHERMGGYQGEIKPRSNADILPLEARAS